MGNGLNKVNVPISLRSGIDTKTDKKQVQGKLLLLQNGIFQTGMEIRKRNGYIALPSLGAGVMLSPYNQELVVLDGQNLYSYNQFSQTQVNKGSLPTVSLEVQNVVRNTTQQTVTDSAKNSGLQCFTWLDSSGGIRYSIFDTATEQSIVNNQQLDSAGTVAKVLAIGTKFVIIYVSTSGSILQYRAIDTSTPTTLGGAVTIASDINSGSPVFDATVINGSIFLAYGGTNKVSLFSISSSLALSAQKNFGSDSPSVLTIFSDSSFNVWVSYAKNGENITPTDTFIYAFVLNNAMSSTILAKTTVDDIGSTLPIQNITATVVGTTAQIYYEVIQAAISPGVPLNFVRQNSLTIGGTAGTASNFFLSASIASKVFQNQGTMFVLLAYQSNLQPSYFLVRADGLNVSKLSPSEGGGYTTAHILPEMNLQSSGVYQVATLVKDSVTVQNGVISSQTGVLSAVLTFTTLAPAKFTLGENLMIAGSMMKMYDGGSVVEHGFNLFPEGLYTQWNVNSPSYGGGVGIGSASSPAKKQYSLVYEWTDNEGQVHRSAPSIPITVDLASLAAPSVITGNVVSSPTPPHGGNTITSASGGAIGQFVTLIGQVNNIVNQQIVGVSGGTLTLSPGWINQVSTSGAQFLLSNYPLSIYFLTQVQGSLIVPGFTKNAQAQFGQEIQAPAGFTSDYPAGTWFKSGAFSNVTGLYDTSSPSLGIGNTPLYYGLGAYAVPLKLPTLKFTDKVKVSLAVYATLVNGTIFFRTSDPVNLIYNDKTVDYISFNDVLPDNTLIGNQQLYTTSGEVENIGVPAVGAMTTFKSRAIVVPSENKLSWWPSKQVIPGVPVQFTDVFVQNIDSRIQKILSVGAMDDKIIFGGPSSLFYAVGNGPSLNGQNNDYTEAQLISSDVGMPNPASLILIPGGIMFQSQKGIYLLDRSLAVQYIGADVEAFNAIPVTSAQLMEDVNQVRFTLSNGIELVYDYYYKQWDVFPGLNANDSGIFQNKHTFVSPAGAIWQESPGSFSDAGAVVPLALGSNWMSFANIQGFQRIYSFLLLGEYKSPHTLTIQIYIDFDDDTVLQTETIPVLSEPDEYQFEVFMNEFTAKCQSMKIVITESQDPSSPGEGFSLSNMAFIAGVKTGLNKVPAARQF